MPSSLQNKLLSYTEDPPPAVWDKIEARLDEEYQPADARVAEDLSEFEIAPPSSVWEQISTTISTTPAIVRPMRFGRIAIAATVCGLIALATIFLFRSNGNKSDLVNAGSNGQSSTLSGLTSNGSQPLAATEITSRAPQVIATISSSGKPQQPYGRSRKMNEATTASFLQTVAVNDRIQISAPPLRDDQGQIILNLDLICDPNLPYLMVTAPNGSPTRISDKFRECIPYLNNHPTEEISRTNPCLEQFKAWRDKLLKEVAFVPSANNFFDIFELKELIEE